MISVYSSLLLRGNMGEIMILGIKLVLWKGVYVVEGSYRSEFLKENCIPNFSLFIMLWKE